ncbi:methyltransferase domain-containing protein [Paenalcaligenes niemegkensis]|uniref:class I SAM-dependent methyltransferase n=1 Tax=Paenalcaligenes niemegkensis TaxID=2895469 RepID=UPI0027E2255A|nr:class I SAM-dependent methyltransferase [Paenalcaligenes niemegkensis]MCQ9616085.1 methyltransferase domain-containing protein [Paenalcaligenes niemegkensis]
MGPVENTYTTTFSNTVQLSKNDTVLDVGCGSGALAVLLAKRAKHVHALDYSPAMLKRVQENAAFHQVNNISTICKDWYESWDAVPQCDVVIASRSTLVDDMQAALLRLNQHARKRVYISYPANPYFVDAQVARILGREKQALPDYFYIPAILHAMGIYPNLSFIEYPGPLADTANFDEFLAQLEEGENLGESQRSRLQAWYDADVDRAATGGEPIRWALIDWAPPHTQE